VTDRRGWFHLTTHTYGAWLPGDPRGFRTRHHREHVEGDYKNPPPPGTHADRLDRSRRLLQQEPVAMAPEWRRVVGQAVRDRLAGLGAELLVVAVSATHLHVQARMPVTMTRDWLGAAKRHAWFVARDRGWTGQLWAKRSRAMPIRDRGHQVNAFGYICRHAAEGAWVWTFRDARPPDADPLDQ
jgi:hypothetical protein